MLFVDELAGAELDGKGLVTAVEVEVCADDELTAAVELLNIVELTIEVELLDGVGLNVELELLDGVGLIIEVELLDGVGLNVVVVLDCRVLDEVELSLVVKLEASEDVARLSATMIVSSTVIVDSCVSNGSVSNEVWIAADVNVVVITVAAAVPTFSLHAELITLGS